MFRVTLTASGLNSTHLTITPLLHGLPQDESNLKPEEELTLDLTNPAVAYAVSRGSINCTPTIPAERVVTPEALYAAYKTAVDTTQPPNNPLAAYEQLLPDRKAAWVAVAKLVNGGQ